MQTSDMNKMAAPDCAQCDGVGKVRVARSVHDRDSPISETSRPPGTRDAVGFRWVVCRACGGGGKR